MPIDTDAIILAGLIILDENSPFPFKKHFKLIIQNLKIKEPPRMHAISVKPMMKGPKSPCPGATTHEYTTSIKNIVITISHTNKLIYLLLISSRTT